MRKKICFILNHLVLFVLLFLCFNCAQQENSSIQINDYFGRSVSLNKPAERIIPTYYTEAEILCALGAKNRIVGIGFIHKDAKSPQSYILAKYMPEIYTLPQIGRGRELNIETIISLKPDLVICENQQEVVQHLESLGIKTIAIFPQKINDVFTEIKILGNLINHQTQAGKLINFLKQNTEKIRERTANLPESSLPTVYYVRSDLLTTVSDEGHNEIFRISGGRNVVKSSFSPYSVNISLENLLQWNPDIIIIRDRSPLTVDDILQDSRLANIAAVKQKKVFKEHDGWIEYRIESVLGIIEKAKWFHPELFQDVSAEEEFKKLEGLIIEFNR